MGPVYLDNTEFSLIDTGRTKEQGVIDLTDIENKDRYKIYENGLNRTIKELIKANKKIIFVLDVPEMKFRPQSCVDDRNNIRHRPYGPKIENMPAKEKCKYNKQDYIYRTNKFKKSINEVITKHSNVKLVNVEDKFCDDRYCYNADDKSFLYSDQDHLSKYGSVIVAEEIIKFIP